MAPAQRGPLVTILAANRRLVKLALLPFRAAEKLSTMFMGNGSVSLTNLGRISSQKLTAGALKPRRVLFGGPCKHNPSLQLAEMRRQLEAYAAE